MITSIYILYWVPVQTSLKLVLICTFPPSFVSNIRGSYEKRSRYNVLPLVIVGSMTKNSALCPPISAKLFGVKQHISAKVLFK